MKGEVNLKLKRVAVFATALLLLLQFQAGASGADVEEIISFHSDITVYPNAAMTVQETIVVNSHGQQILHGIYRDFPTIYKDRYGNRHTVNFSVGQVLRDGVPEDYHIAGRVNGQRVYIGQSDTYVASGVHTYILTYYTDRQIGFYKDYDELYWNVTGNGWVFPIRQASATVHLPRGVPAQDIRVSGSTGPFGSQEQDFSSSFDPGQNVIFQANKPLNPYEGLTIVAVWPKGFVTEPSWQKKLGYFLQDNKVYFLLFLGLLAVFLYYLYFWNKLGRDPVQGTIIPNYTPPGDMSPAAMRFVDRMGFDIKTLTCAVINMAVKGVLDIMEAGGGEYVLRRKPKGQANLSVEEEAVYNALPFDGLFNLSDSNYTDIQRMIMVCRNVLSDHCEGSYFITNKRFVIGGTIVSALICLGLFIMSGPVLLLIAAGLLFVTLNIVFYHLLKAPTLPGRQLMDQIEGFKMFLTVAEKERLNTLYPEGRTPQLFEKYLPYALALDVEQVWAQQFADVLARAGSDEVGYIPVWYSGTAWSPHHPARFASTLGGSFSHAISSASTPPGSSSGFDGGSSGGGGGGGGGGGW